MKKQEIRTVGALARLSVPEFLPLCAHIALTGCFGAPPRCIRQIAACNCPRASSKQEKNRPLCVNSGARSIRLDSVHVSHANSTCTIILLDRRNFEFFFISFFDSFVLFLFARTDCEQLIWAAAWATSGRGASSSETPIGRSERGCGRLFFTPTVFSADNGAFRPRRGTLAHPGGTPESETGERRCLLLPFILPRRIADPPTSLA